MFSFLSKRASLLSLSLKNMTKIKITAKPFHSFTSFPGELSIPLPEQPSPALPNWSEHLQNQQEEVTSMEFLNKTSKRAKRKRAKRKYGRKIQMSNM